jgi:hypothetical protein
MPDTFADASRPPEAAIEIRLGRPQQLFNSLDHHRSTSEIWTRTRKRTSLTRPTSLP